MRGAIYLNRAFEFYCAVAVVYVAAKVHLSIFDIHFVCQAVTVKVYQSHQAFACRLAACIVATETKACQADYWAEAAGGCAADISAGGVRKPQSGGSADGCYPLTIRQKMTVQIGV